MTASVLLANRESIRRYDCGSFAGNCSVAVGSAALDSGDASHIAEETGDLLFSLVNLARHAKADPEMALRATNAKFERRFAYIERSLASRGSSLEKATLEEMDALWNEAKDSEKNPVT